MHCAAQGAQSILRIGLKGLNCNVERFFRHCCPSLLAFRCRAPRSVAVPRETRRCTAGAESGHAGQRQNRHRAHRPDGRRRYTRARCEPSCHTRHIEASSAALEVVPRAAVTVWPCTVSVPAIARDQITSSAEHTARIVETNEQVHVTTQRGVANAAWPTRRGQRVAANGEDIASAAEELSREAVTREELLQHFTVDVRHPCG